MMICSHKSYATLLSFTFRALFAFCFLLPSTFILPPVLTASLPQADDPAAQCTEGIKLFEAGKYAEALPLLEAGFANREKATLATPDDLGFCAGTLGNLYYQLGKNAEALEANLIALRMFRQSGNRENEGIILNNIGLVYYSQGQYAKALDSYKQALAIKREVGDRAGEGTPLNNIGGVYQAQGRYAEALESYQQALVIYQEVGDRAGEGTTLNNIGVVYDAQGRYAKALEAYRQALVIAREIGNRANEAATLNGIGVVYDSQGRYAEALDYYQQALAIVREVGNRAGESSTLHNIGKVYHDQGRYAEALEVYQQTLAIRREVGNRAGEGNTLHSIGEVYAGQGFYTKALEYYQQALAIRREVGDRAGEGSTLHKIGVIYALQMRYAEALDAYQQALAIRREVGDRVGEGDTLNNIGMAYIWQGRYAEALEVYQQALAIKREVGDRAGEGTPLNNIGGVYQVQGRYAEALDYYQQALVIAREVGDRTGEGITLNNIGMVYWAQGRYPESLEAYKQALVIAREVGNRVNEAATLNGIGGVYDSEGRYAEALDYYQQALVIAREVGDRTGEGTTLSNIGGVYDLQMQYVEALESYQQALAIKREVGDRAGEGTVLSNIGMLYESQGLYAEALEYYEQAMLVFETLRSVAGSDPARASYIEQYAPFYDRVVKLYYQQNQPERAFLTTERGRARTFLDAMATGYVELSDSKATALYAQEQESYAARQAAQDALAKAKAQNPPDAQLIANLEAQLAQAEKDYQAVLEAITARGGQLAQLVPGRSAVLDLPQAQALLDDQTTLLSFWVLDEQTLVFILTRNTFNTIALPITREDLYTQIQAFRAFANTDIAYPESAITLYSALIEPLKSYLTTPHLVIVSHGNLHYLPIAALTDGSRFLIDDYTLTYLPSISAWQFIQLNTGRADANPLILGNPATHNAELKPLPYAESEAQAIADLYRTTPLLGQDATESAVRVKVERAGVLHLAAHGSYNLYNPLYSAIYLTPDDKNDGLLETHEIFGLNLGHTDLVVLSACETQLGKLSAGDEMVGLTRSFFFAGTPSVLASLWSVNDRATQLLMEKFYTYWRAGMGKAQALQQAQIEMRSEYPNPYYWAAFVLNGEGGPITDVQLVTDRSLRGAVYRAWLQRNFYLRSTAGQGIVWSILGTVFLLAMFVLFARGAEKGIWITEGHRSIWKSVRPPRFSPVISVGAVIALLVSGAVAWSFWQWLH